MKPFKRRAVFLDRDGTINEEVGYLKSLDALSIIPGAAKGISILNRLGYKVIVVTNQSGVARGFFSESFLVELHAEIEARLHKENALIDRWCYCPHHPTEGINEYRITCSCRKPAPGMVQKVAEEKEIDLLNSFVIGDNIKDVELAINAGVRSILVRTGHGEKTLSIMSPEQRDNLSYVAQDLLDACRWISRNHIPLVGDFKPAPTTEKDGKKENISINPELLKIIACPKCKGDIKLSWEEKGLICTSCRLIYEIREGIPVMIIEEARSF